MMTDPQTNEFKAMPGDRLLDGREVKLLVIHKNPHTGQFIGLNQNGLIGTFGGLVDKSEPKVGDVIRIPVYARGEDTIVPALYDVLAEFQPWGMFATELAAIFLEGYEWFDVTSLYMVKQAVDSGSYEGIKAAILSTEHETPADRYRQKYLATIGLVEATAIAELGHQELVEEFFGHMKQIILDTVDRAEEHGGKPLFDYRSPNREVQVIGQYLHTFAPFDGYKYQLSVQHPRFKSGESILVGLYRTEEELENAFGAWKANMTNPALLPNLINNIEYVVPEGHDFSLDTKRKFTPENDGVHHIDEPMKDFSLVELCRLWIEEQTKEKI